MRSTFLSFPLVAAMALAAPPCAAQGTAPASGPAQAPAASSVQEKRPFLGGFLRETRVIYPLRIGDWEAVDEHLYDDQSLGASVRYRNLKHDQRWLDLYFYPAGVIDAKDLDRAMEVQRESLGMAGYGQLELGPTRTFRYESQPALEVDGKRTERQVGSGRSLDATMVYEGVRRNSAMTLQYEQMYFIKGRLSAREDDASRRGLRNSLEEFATAVVPQLEVRSAGDCWQPLPIAPMPAGGVPAAEVIMSLDDGAGGKSVLTGAGVWADHPDSNPAKLAMMLGMARMDRLFDGCVATEDLNAPVPEGKRELRLEFHAPEETSDDPAPRLRPSRTADS